MDPGHVVWKDVLQRIVDGDDLGETLAQSVMDDVLSGSVTDAELAAFAVGMRMKGETTGELVGFARAMIGHSARLNIPREAIDIVGTGGSVGRQQHALNVSTMASFVAAASGAVVCKHGNYKATSTSGSFDFLAELGVSVPAEPSAVEASVGALGLGFAPARLFHPAMRHAAEVRSAIGVRTVFNVLGPIAHPGRVRRQLVGAANESTARNLAGALHRLGSERAWVVVGADGLDEITTVGPSIVFEVTPQDVTQVELDVQCAGIDPPRSAEDLIGGSARDNVGHFSRILAGDDGPRTDMIVANAGAALVVAGRASDLTEGVAVARESISSGKALALVERTTAFEAPTR